MVRKIAVGIAAILALLVLAMVAASLWVSRPLYDARLDPASLNSIAIAPPDQALTFARYRDGGRLQVLLVTQYENGRVSGFNLQRDLGTDDSNPISLFNRLGYEALEHLAQSDRIQKTMTVAELVLPFDAPLANIGIGTNYLEHARESQVAEKPFVFPKLVQPTHFTADVAKGDSRLLDYEAELGFVALEDIAPGSRPQTMGLVLGNDFTDRWSLVLNFSGDTEMGTTGFVEGKSREGYAPIGNLLVIPKNLDAFYRELELKLYVNRRLRQRDRAGSMEWGPGQMLKEIFAREGWSFRRYDGTVPLLPRAATLPQGTIIFSGTPAGVIFKPLNLWNHWTYLQPGDEVVILSETLGSLRNTISE
jgi:2,4-diketo-3-deoxy-L-fuconate hydrolase